MGNIIYAWNVLSKYDNSECQGQPAAFILHINNIQNHKIVYMRSVPTREEAEKFVKIMRSNKFAIQCVHDEIFGEAAKLKINESPDRPLLHISNYKNYLKENEYYLDN